MKKKTIGDRIKYIRGQRNKVEFAQYLVRDAHKTVHGWQLCSNKNNSTFTISATYKTGTKNANLSLFLSTHNIMGEITAMPISFH